MLRHLTRLLIACALLTPVIAGTAQARPSANNADDVTVFQDLRSPDVRDGARTGSLAGTPSAPPQDLRSPDAADASRADEIALAQERYYTTATEPVAAPAPAAPADGTPWGSIAISVAAALLLAGGFAVLIRRQRRTARVTA